VPVPLEFVVIHETFDTAVQEQPLCVVMAKVPVPRVAGTDDVSGLRLYVQPLACVIVNV
jgi:hypothetical protein